MAHKNVNGGCPYCGYWNLEDVEDPDPRFDYVHCPNCESYSAKGKNGTTYPLLDRKNIKSSVVVKTK